MTYEWVEPLLKLDAREAKRQAQDCCIDALDALFELIEGAQQTDGRISTIAAELGIATNTVRKWRRQPSALLQKRMLEKLASAPKYRRLHEASRKAIAALEALRIARALAPIP